MQNIRSRGWKIFAVVIVVSCILLGAGHYLPSRAQKLRIIDTPESVSRAVERYKKLLELTFCEDEHGLHEYNEYDRELATWRTNADRRQYVQENVQALSASYKYRVQYTAQQGDVVYVYVVFTPEVSVRTVEGSVATIRWRDDREITWKEKLTKENRTGIDYDIAQGDVAIYRPEDE